MNNSFGLYENSFTALCNAIKKNTEIEQAWIFGSRALGNYKKGSDIDLAIAGKTVNFDVVSKLHRMLNDELNIPYFVDVVDFNDVKSQELKQHIQNKGIGIPI